MHQGNQSRNNMNPMVQQGTTGSRGAVQAGNNITMRGNEIPEFLPSDRASRNIVQAHFKVLKFYRKVCRLLPFILRVHNLASATTPEQAMVNVANIIRTKSYLRDPSMVDYWVQEGYEQLMQAEWHMLNRDHLWRYLCNENHSVTGYSYLEQVKNKGKSSFLQDFVTGDKPYEY